MRLPVSLKPFPVGKVAPQGRMRGRFATAIRLRATEARFPLISQRAGPLTASPEGEAMQQKSAVPFQEQRFYLLHRSIRYQNRQFPAYQSAAVLPVSETLGGRGQHHAVERRRGGQREL